MEDDICWLFIINSHRPFFFPSLFFCMGSQFMFVVPALVSLSNRHLQVMLYWIMITVAEVCCWFLEAPWNLVTDNGQCHWERQINIPTSTPAVTSENRSSLPPAAKINLISVFITYRASPENSSLWNNSAEQLSSRLILAKIMHEEFAQRNTSMSLCNVSCNSVRPGPRCYETTWKCASPQVNMS